MASSSVRSDSTGRPQRGERHGAGAPTVDVVAVVGEPLDGSLHAAGMGALRPLGDRQGAGLGSASHPPAVDGLGPGGLLAGAGTRRRGGRRGARSCRAPLRRMEQERPARWGRYHPLALDEAPRHRTSTQGGAPARFRRRAPAAPIVPRPGGRSTGARGGMGCPAGQGPRGRRPPVCTVGAASGLLGRRAAPRGGWRWRDCATRPPSRVRRAWP
jgi:hypothetical protein